ncbi:MAG: ribosomal protein S18 acetylase RimI-like enzyme [Kiritimatiellia bacterium]|jgi:ribosomal protein S18 acetylase RimI-like enzyme
MSIRVAYVRKPDERLVNEVARRLDEYNVRHIQMPVDDRIVALAADQSGELVGGAIAYSQWGYLSLEVLWVDEDQRRHGIGARLMHVIEEEGRQRGCHSAHTDTFTFQAPSFYLSLGYEVFGQLEGYAAGQTRYYLVKRL